ncbi:MAG: GNAT family N-acetyltransferase [Clostridia bacterium]|nr:GNAT family N-acetyltransferase [Clostridia bacterium]
MNIRYMTPEDRAFAKTLRDHATDEQFALRVQARNGYVLEEDGVSVGIMHHCIFWDSLPIMNLIYLAEEHRRKGYGAQAMRAWEADMLRRGYKMVMISTQADEEAQHFYRKLGYVDCGAWVLNNEPTELFLCKTLKA